MSTAVRVAELESLFTADVRPLEKAAVKVETRKKDLRKPVDVKVDADTKGAQAGMDRVEADAKKLTAKDVITRVDANIAQAEKKAEQIRGNLAVLEAMDTTPQVDADIAKAKAALGSVERSLQQLRGARARLEVIADTSQAVQALDDVGDQARAGAKEAGQDAGGNLAGGIIAAIATIPVAGAIVGIGAAIGDALLDGLDNEVREDRLAAATGLDADTVARIGRAAGESYANAWGESIAANMDTARAAIQAGLLDPAATARDTQAIISSLSGVSDILGEDIPRVTRSAMQLLRTGLARDAAGAFDIIVKGQQAGLNVSEDWLDTIDEYSTKFRDLGLDGGRAMGLLSQAVRAGARDTDTAADALKEFAIRAQDGSTATIHGFQTIGLSAQEMAAKIAAGGPAAAEALDLTLGRLRAIEDPVLRNAAAVELFGTKAEDMGDALFAMDLSTAVSELGEFEGAAARALGVLGDNAAADIESAQRNIEVAADGIKGALAAAFNPQIEDFGTYVSENREQVLQFLLDIANGGLDFARTFVEGTATATESVGEFIGGPLADLILAIGDLVYGIDAATPGDQHGTAFREWANNAAESMQDVQESTAETADTIRTNLIENGIDPAQRRLNEFAIPLIAQAALHDATVTVAAGIDGIGYAADGSRVAMSLLNGEFDTSTESGRLLDEQVRAAAEALAQEALRAQESGESHAELNARYAEGRQALIDQLAQMGLTGEQAETLAAQYGAVPGGVDTVVNLHTTEAERRLAAFKAALRIPDIVITADMRAAGGYYANRASGGPVFGPGTETSDSIPARLSTNEHVWAASEVRGAGGHANVAALRAAARAGALRVVEPLRFADGGTPATWSAFPMRAAGAGGDTVHITVIADVSKLRSVAELERFLESARRLGRQKAGMSGG